MRRAIEMVLLVVIVASCAAAIVTTVVVHEFPAPWSELKMTDAVEQPDSRHYGISCDVLVARDALIDQAFANYHDQEVAALVAACCFGLALLAGVTLSVYRFFG